MLHAGCVQFGSWDERPARGVPLDLEERVHGLWRLQVVDTAMLEQSMLASVFLRRVACVVTVTVFGSA